jgi:hypothetical protein
MSKLAAVSQLQLDGCSAVSSCGGGYEPIEPDSPLFQALQKVAEWIDRKFIHHARKSRHKEKVASNLPINSPLDPFGKTNDGLGNVLSSPLCGCSVRPSTRTTRPSADG